MSTKGPTREGRFSEFEDSLRALVRQAGTLEAILARAVGEGDTNARLRFLRTRTRLIYGFDEKMSQKDAEEEDALYSAATAKFVGEYEVWYSLSRRVIRDVLPERESDFVSQYDDGTSDPKDRKRISHYLARVDAGALWAEELLSRFRIQKGILDAAQVVLGSRLASIADTLHADLFDSELDAARALCDLGFERPAGMMAGVVLESHLTSVCERRKLPIDPKPRLSTLMKRLKDARVVDLATWRRTQHLADLRNKCAHKSQSEPTAEEVIELIDSVAKVVKTIH